MSRQGVIALRTAATPALWGTTYIVATELLPAGRPMLAAAARALPIGLIFVLRTRTLPTGDWWWRTLILGFLNIGAFFALLFVAAFRLPGGVAATAGAIQPLIAAGLATVIIGEPFTRRFAIASVLGIVGVAMLVLGPEASLDRIGIAAALAGAASMATGVVATKHWGRPVDLLTFTGWQLTAGGLMLVPVVAFTEGLPSTVTGANLAGFVWLGVAGTGFAYANWFRGIQQLPVAITSILGLLSPMVAAVVGWVVLGQRLSPLQLVGAALCLTALTVAQRQSHRLSSSPLRRLLPAFPGRRRTRTTARPHQ